MRFLLCLLPSLLAAQTYDIVLQHGRVMDPESGLDAVRSVGITGGKIAAISASPCAARWK
jgi:predicted amidohydrolase